MTQINTLARNYDGYGSGYLSPDCGRFHVNIPKNASSYMGEVLSHNGWNAALVGDNCDWHRVREMVVILRDPVDRWCSGVAQYLQTKILHALGPNTYTYSYEDDTIDDIEDHSIPADAFLIAYSPLIERFIFDNLDLLDDHVWPQRDFFESLLPTVPRHYILLTESLNRDLTDLGIKIPCVDRSFFNTSEDDDNKKTLKRFFHERLSRKANLFEKVRMTYQRDYDLIQQVFGNHV